MADTVRGRRCNFSASIIKIKKSFTTDNLSGPGRPSVILSAICVHRPDNNGTRSSAIAEGSRYALCQLKTCQLLHSYTKNRTENGCSRRMMLKGHWNCRYSLGDISLPISGL